ncbi:MULTISPECIES: ParB/RepB/Spo0J family partition protein [unclassified Duganella]|uniref:ParB/RepB/Spo0J family partition protein n=1 Tax=unclassified Duganella TaxID=2636909 RepID=UPI001587B99F|nr:MULTISPECIES: ParB/RepB/Spo0J family partition protein [unclassified Duganella]
MNKLIALPPPAVLAPADQVIVVDELVMEGYRDVPLHLVRISYTNRTRFNPEALQQLADNIAEVGILQPILMRPVTPTAEAPQILEVVAGERRFRAAVMAGLHCAPASIKILSDKQAAEIQLLENIQRENPHPLEEAIGFEQLMLNHGYTADQLAAKVKRSRSYVYASLKLCALSLRARELFLDDVQRFPASTALLIARIPTPGLQDKALGEIMAPQHNGDPMSVRQAAQHIAGRYTLNLESAPFDPKDAKLLAGAGNCGKCPKRTGNQPEIYADTKSADVCTDPDCYAEKKAAHYQRIVVIASKKGIPVLEGAEAVAAEPYSWGRDEEFVTEDHHLSAFDRVAPATGMAGTIKKHIAAADMPAPAKYLRFHDGSVKALYRSEDVQAALEKTGACESEEARAAREDAGAADPTDAGKPNRQQEAAEKQRLERAERQRKATAMTVERVALYRKIRLSAKDGLSLHMLRELAKLMVRDDMNEMSIPDDLIGDLYPFDRDDDSVCAFIDQADAATVQLLVMDLVMGEGLSVSSHYIEEEESEPDARYLAINSIAVAADITTNEADLAATAAALVVRGIDVCDLETADDVLEVLEQNLDHLNAVCAHVIAEAPHHLSNVEQAAHHLGYEYGTAGWHKKTEAQANSADTTTPAEPDHAESPAAEQQPRSKLSIKPKAAATQAEQAGPVVKVKKNRAAQAQAAAPLAPAAAWPFPTPNRSQP